MSISKVITKNGEIKWELESGIITSSEGNKIKINYTTLGQNKINASILKDGREIECENANVDISEKGNWGT